VFSQLFFVLLALILINFTSDLDMTFWIQNPIEAFLWGVVVYFLFLAFLYGQSKYVARPLKKKRVESVWWFLVNLELLLFLAIYHFGLGAHRFFQQGRLSSYQTPFILASLLFYFLALCWTHLWYSYFQLRHSFKKALKTAWQQLLFVCPFCIPFVLISCLLDALEHLSFWQSNKIQLLEQELILSILGLCLLGIVTIFLPAFIVICWGCRPLDCSDLKDRLDRMCASLHFRHAGLKIWSIMSHSFTAGIIGIVPAFRYILFTPTLLKQFTPEEIEAILIHEIGHNRHRHLLLYPFIMLGMLVSGALGLAGLENFFSFKIEPAETGYFTLLIGIFIIYALLMGIYFRFIFGFFSRLFERQADLYIFESSLSPMCLIQSLDHLGIATGNTHSHPSWHHFSIQERIRFLYQAMENPSLVQRHHRRVRKWLILYFLGLLASCYFLYLLL